MDKGADNINMEQNYDDSGEKVRLRNVRIGIAKNLTFQEYFYQR